MKIHVVRDADGMKDFVRRWDDLCECCPYATTFSRPEWLLSWVEHFEPDNPIFLVLEQGDRLVGLAPLLIYREGTDRVLGLMGGGVSDYLDLLAAQEHETEVVTALWTWIEDHKQEWDRMFFSDLNARSPLVRGVQPTAGEQVSEHDVCPTLTSDGSLGLEQLVPAKQLRNLRNARSRSLRAGGATIEVANSDSLTAMMESLFNLHSVRWNQAGQAGVLESARVLSFHRQVAPLLLAKGVLKLYGLRFQDRVIGALYSFFEKQTVYCYLQGYDPVYHRLSPGTQVLGAVIEDAIHQGKARIDFLRGREEYKYLWGARDETTYRVTVNQQSYGLTLRRSA